MRKSRFSKTPSETAVPFLLCSLSVYFLFHSSFSRKEEKEKVDKNPARLIAMVVEQPDSEPRFAPRLSQIVRYHSANTFKRGALEWF